jgi:HK97 family phage major capsid protein
LRCPSARRSARRALGGSFVQGVRRGGLDASPFERRVNPSRTDGQGGYFVPPLWLVDQYIKGLRAGRVAADLCRQMDLPQGTDSINIPKIATGTTTAVQTADGAAVSSTDFTDTVVTAPVRTIAGQQDVALQLVEQSPGQIVDQAILEDLTADYNMQVDRQVLTGTGANGQITGLLPVSNWSGANTVTWTSASPVGQSFNAALNASASKASYNRYDLSALASVVHPRRGFWYGSTLDGSSGTSGRPLVNPRDSAYNVVAIGESRLPAEGRIAGTSLGYGIYIDGNMPIVATAAGAVTGGTNDLALTAHWDDLWLFEGQLRTRVLGEVLSGTLQVRFQVYSYVAFLARYGQSISVVLGTGLAAPTYAGDTTITF